MTSSLRRPSPPSRKSCIGCRTAGARGAPPARERFRAGERRARVLRAPRRVPAGVVLTLSPWAVHRDGRWWEDPTAYRPERWLRETEGGVAHGDDAAGPAVGERPEYAYFSFGGGPRHCIGMRFARQELRLAIGTLLRRVRLESVTESLSLRASANTRPDGPVRIRVRGRPADADDGPDAARSPVGGE
ncbi:MAG: cytochrome P450 [Halorubrum sp.]